ncbi:hypothetical protein DLAC_07296 [Tieghemostelium lacteum]|uniref:Kinetochore protein SPC25 n=1 Tax=Tieghemostelium lacteum TaxID=361077 RepID=A0A151ZC80_TIELA|nr:hypothetical protein DLAC_07296 [Tieghemostelium lacteum]|eukprot:KYQ91535.1 hypothetical protein DLAC_07296 [Tieghemostelium lacteum]
MDSEIDIYSMNVVESEMKRMEEILENWKTSHFETYHHNNQNAVQVNQHCIEEMSRLTQEKLFLHQTAEDSKKIIEKQKKQILDLQTEINKLQIEGEKLPKQLETFTISHNEEAKELQQLSETVKIQEQKVNRSLNSLSHIFQLFKQYLSLEFKRFDDKFKFIFTNINRVDNDKAYHITIQIEKQSEIYRLIECQPAIPNIEDLVLELNQTNNLSSFVKKIRSEFVKIQ